MGWEGWEEWGGWEAGGGPYPPTGPFGVASYESKKCKL